MDTSEQFLGAPLMTTFTTWRAAAEALGKRCQLKVETFLVQPGVVGVNLVACKSTTGPWDYTIEHLTPGRWVVMQPIPPHSFRTLVFTEQECT